VAITWFGYAFGEHLDFVDTVLSRFGYGMLGLLVAFFLGRWLWKRWRKAKDELPGPVEHQPPS
jgi:membrane protein DedA with SNARE-associated domain